MNGILTKAGWLVVAAAMMAGISACNIADKLQPEDEASAILYILSLLSAVSKMII